MKKIITIALLLASVLSLSACSKAPDELPSELVSVNFEDNESSLPGALNTSNNSEESEAEPEIPEAAKRLQILGSGLVNAVVDDNKIEYNGGKIKIPCVLNYSCRTENVDEAMSVGCLVSINGVLQKISCNDLKDEYMYIDKDYKKEDFTYENGRYNARRNFILTFEPQINEEDKDLENLQITIITVTNPLYKLDPSYPVSFTVHRAAPTHTITLNLKSPINNFTYETISKNCFTELEITKEVMKKYSDFERENDFEGYTGPFTDTEKAGKSSFKFDKDGNLNMGFITSLRSDESEIQGRYLVTMFINGSPHSFPDGSMYKSLNMENGKVYVYEAEDFSKIFHEYDTVSFLPIASLSENGERILSSSQPASAVLPNQ